MARQRATVCFRPELYRALKIKAAATRRGVSELVSEAVQVYLCEDAIDEAALQARGKETSREFSGVLRELKRARLL